MDKRRKGGKKMITVVITTYKREYNMLKRAIDSVLNQSFKDWELIIVDDSPSDWKLRKEVSSSVEALCRNDTRIKYIKHTKNLGACAARNTGLRIANGEYIAFLDDDDEWQTNKLQLQVEKFLNASDCVSLVYCGTLCVDEENNKTIKHKNRYLKGKVFDELIMKNFIGGTSYPLIKTEILREVGGFDDKMESSQDFDVWIRLCKEHEVDYVPEELVIYYTHKGEQISTSPIKIIKGKERILSKYHEYLIDHKKQFAYCTLELAVAYAIYGDYKQSLLLWKEGCKLFPVGVITNIKGILRILKWVIVNARNNRTKCAS